MSNFVSKKRNLLNSIVIQIKTLRLDVDYAEDDTRGNAGVGAVARDSDGNIIFALAKRIAASPQVTHGELRAIMHGVCQCVEDQLSPVEVDSILAVHILGNDKEVPGVLNEDLFDFFVSVKDLNILSINHMRREANGVAHELASLAKSISFPLLWHDEWPLWLLNIVANDLI